MVYSDTTFATDGIIQNEEVLCNLGNGGISGNSTLLKQFTNLNNRAYYEVWMAYLSVDKNNVADDYNYTNIPDAPIALVASQSDYTLPVAVTGGNVSSFLRVKGVYYTDSTGYRSYLRQMDNNETLVATDGIPSAYRTNGKSFFLDVQPSSTFVSDYTNIHVEFQRVPDAFLSTDTTQQPGFMETYHDLIPLKASALYLLPSNPSLSDRYEQRFLTRLELFKRDVAQIDEDLGKYMTAEVIMHR